MNNIPQIPTSALPTVRQAGVADASAFGLTAAKSLSDGAKGLGQAAGAIGDVAADLLYTDDRTKAKNAGIQLDAAIRDVFYSTSAENPGYFSRQGQDAVSHYEPTRRILETKKQEIFESLQNERQQKLFSDFANASLSREQDKMAQYSSKHHGVWQNQVSTASIDNAILNATANYNDPSRLAESLVVIHAENANIGKRAGLPPEVIVENIRLGHSKLHSLVIERMAVNDPMAAKKYFDENSNGFWGADAIKAERLIKGMVSLREAQQISDSVMAKYGPTMAALNAIRQEPDPNKRQEGEAQFMRMVAHNQAFTNAQSAAENRAEVAERRQEAAEQKATDRNARDLSPEMARNLFASHTREDGSLDQAGMLTALTGITEPHLANLVKQNLDKLITERKTLADQETRKEWARISGPIIAKRASNFPVGWGDVSPEDTVKIYANPELLDKMTLMIAQGGTPKQTRPEITSQLIHLGTEEPYKLKEFLDANKHMLSISDQAKWEKKAAEVDTDTAKVARNIVDSMFKDVTINGIIAAQGLNTKRVDGHFKNQNTTLFSSSLQEEIEEYIKAHNKNPDINWQKSRAIALSAKVSREGSWLGRDNAYEARKSGGFENMNVEFQGLHKVGQGSIRDELKAAGILAPTVPVLNQMAAAYVLGDDGKTQIGDKAITGREIKTQAIIAASPDKVKAALTLGVVTKDELRNAAQDLQKRGLPYEGDATLNALLEYKRGGK